MIDETSNPKKGVFIVLEGIDGSGKSTLAANLANHFPNAVLTREPCDFDDFSRDIKKIIEKYYVNLDSKTAIYLFNTLRTYHIETLIKPSLDEGKIVICDRFSPSTFAYNCLESLALASLSHLLEMENKIAPDITFYLRFPDPIRVPILEERRPQEDPSYLKKVQTMYDAYFWRRPCDILNATCTKEVLRDWCIYKINELISKREKWPNQ